MQKYCEEVQDRINEVDNKMRSYASELVLDSEDIKKVCREYIQGSKNNLEEEIDSLAQMCIILLENALLEQGVASQVMKAE